MYIDRFHQILDEVVSLTNKTNKHAVLIIQQRPNNDDLEPVFPMIRESLSNIIAFACIADEHCVEPIVRASKNIIDTIIMDDVHKRTNSRSIVDTVYNYASACEIPVMTYNDFDIWTSSAVNLIKSNEHSNLSKKKILLLGHNYLSTRILLQLIDTQAEIYVMRSEFDDFTLPYIGTTTISIDSPHLHYADDIREFDILLGCCLHQKSSNIKALTDCIFGAIYDVGVSNFDEEFIALQKQKGCKAIYRSDDRAGIASMVLHMMETNYLSRYCMGRISLGKVHIVAGGIIGEQGDVVVDSIESPRKIFGVANGDGTFKKQLTNNDLLHIEKVKTILS